MKLNMKFNVMLITHHNSCLIKYLFNINLDSLINTNLFLRDFYIKTNYRSGQTRRDMRDFIYII